MDRITSDNGDIDLPSQVGHSNLPRWSTPDNINARSPSLTEHRDLPHESTPDVDAHSPSQTRHSRLPCQITPDDVDTRWPYRAGFPRLLRPSVVSIPIEDEAEKPISDTDLDRLQLRINEILDSYDLPPCDALTGSPEVVHRRQKFGPSSLPRVLIPCAYDKDTSHSKKWAEAVVDIYAEIQSVAKGDCEVGVELVDEVIMNSQLCSLPTPMSQELSANWVTGHNYCEKILHLFETPHDMFQVMVPIGRCWVKQASVWLDRDLTYEWTAVVFFDALNAEDVLWDSLEEKIRSILPSHIDIEIRQRSGPLFSSSPFSLDKDVEVHIPKPSPEEYARPPRLGCDISAEGSCSAGTMGGYVVTEDENGKKTTYGVTNAHVALQKSEKCTFTASADSGIRIVSPSEMSRTEAKSKLLKRIPWLENKIAQRKKTIELYKERDPARVRETKKNLESNELSLASAKSALELMEQDPYVGSVHNASCGNTVYSTASSQCCEIMMDLALIKMHCPGAERPQEIYLKQKDTPPDVPEYAACGFWETDSLGVSHDGDGKNHIKVVGKLSRTGVYTFGIVNDFRAIAFPFTENGVKNDKKYYMWVASNPAFQIHGPFSDEGDAGSFVIAAADWEYADYDNRVAMPSPQALRETTIESMQPFVVGLIFGGSKNEGVSYFIPFDAVKSEIESLTGEEMVWPRKRSDCVRDDVA